MPTSATGKARNTLPGLNEQTETGKAKAVAATARHISGPEPRAVLSNKSRKPKAREEVDSDYAEEAEDFFYGEGM